jgi:retinol dehydrogenase 14
MSFLVGGNTGIGLETAVDLASRGGKIYIACRDITRGENAVVEIRERSGSDSVHLLVLDLASLDSIREFARKFHELENRLDILICNAGNLNLKLKVMCFKI